MNDIPREAKNYIRQLRQECADNPPLVAIRCITYNQEKYIGDTLRGFVSQQAPFRFVAVVHDDASTDRTPKIIAEYAEKYPHIIKPLYEKDNQYSKGDGTIHRILDEAINATGAKYMAFCEGDDYWIDPLKLSKQVDFMEKNPDVALCYTSFNICDQINGKNYSDLFKTDPQHFPSSYTPEEFILKKGYVCPPSWLIRLSEWKKEVTNSCDGTFVRFTDFLCTSKVASLPDVTCVYRKIPESASHSKNYEKIYKRQKNLLETQFKLIDLYGLPQELKKSCREDHYKKYLKTFVTHGKHDDVERAREILPDKNLATRCLLLIDTLRLNPILMGVKKIKDLF